MAKAAPPRLWSKFCASDRLSPRQILLVPGERIELPTNGLQNRCSTAELTRLRLKQLSALLRCHKPDRGGRLSESRLTPDDQAIALSFSSTSISQAAACKIASRCASFERRKVALSNVYARL